MGAVIRLHIREYQVDIVAAKEGILHAGIEYKAGEMSAFAYFVVIHLQQ